MILRYYYYFGIFNFNTFIYLKNKEFMSELYSFSKATRFFRKPLYQPSPNAVPVIPFVNGKFKPNDTKTFFIGMGGMRKAKKDNVLKLNGISGPG